MNQANRSRAATLGQTLVALSAALLLRQLLDPVMGSSLPLVTLFAAVAFAAWIGGIGSAVFVALPP